MEAVHLTVSDGNGPTLRLYTRLGVPSPWAFQPRALKLEDGTYVDEIAMVRRFAADEANSAQLEQNARLCARIWPKLLNRIWK